MDSKQLIKAIDLYLKNRGLCACGKKLGHKKEDFDKAGFGSTNIAAGGGNSGGGGANIPTVKNCGVQQG